MSVAPSTVSLLPGGVQDFAATVTNDVAGQGVTWVITGCSGGAAPCGSLSNVTSTTATYAASATVPPGTLGITAISVSDNSKEFTATVAISAMRQSDRIAFVSNRDGNDEIYVMVADGSGQVNITNNAASDYGAVWSPDGSRIAFLSSRDRSDGSSDIYAMHADGSGVVRLTTGGASQPAWSPDGSKIAFAWDGIYVMNADGSGQIKLTDYAGTNGSPVWSPDGRRIVFQSSRDGNYEIYVINADGSGLQNLTNDSAFDFSPVWSPDGSKIAFISARRSLGGIFVMNADGSGATYLGVPLASTPAWSPDGTRIAFGRHGIRCTHPCAWIDVMNANGSGVRPLTGSGNDVGPVWSPDGSRIAFQSSRDGNAEIYLMNADGSGVTRLTNNPASDTQASWSP